MSSANLLVVITSSLTRMFSRTEVVNNTLGMGETELMSVRLRRLRASFQSKSAKKAVQRKIFQGVSRRAVDLMPAPMANQELETTRTNHLRFHQLLINIEGTQVTGCFKISSPAAKSRSAILAYRGRALGCVFGEKSMRQQLFGEEALACALEDLSCPDNVVTAYQLPENIVLAAAAMFQGHQLDLGKQNSSKEYFQEAVERLVAGGSYGTIVVRRKDDGAITLVYIAQGKVIGAHSNKEGWLDTTYTGSLFDLMGTDEVEVSGSALLAQSGDDAYLLGMSLTGLSDRRFGYSKVSDSLKAKIVARQRRWHAKKESKRMVGGPQPTFEQTYEEDVYTGFHAASMTGRPIRHAHLIRP